MAKNGTQYFSKNYIYVKISGMHRKNYGVLQYILRCDIVIFIFYTTNIRGVTINERNVNQQIPKCQLVDDIGALFGDKSLSPNIITCNTQLNCLERHIAYYGEFVL